MIIDLEKLYVILRYADELDGYNSKQVFADYDEAVYECEKLNFEHWDEFKKKYPDREVDFSQKAFSVCNLRETIKESINSCEESARENGYNDGYSDGKADSEGFDDGYEAGKNDGYSNGYEAGYEAGKNSVKD